MIYFENASTTRIDETILNAMTNVMKNNWGNPSSIHSAGTNAKKLLDKSRKDILSLLQIPDWKLISTSGATESNNLAIIGLALAHKKGHIITVKTEHKSVLEPFKHLSSMGFSITTLNVDSDGQIDVDELRSAIRNDTFLLSFSFVNNETGIFQKKWEKIVKIAHENNIVVHTDAVQAIGHVNADWSKFDMITITAHKIGGPKGIGCLIVNPLITLSPIIFGGDQEFSLRGGTENVAGLYAFSLALKRIISDMKLEEIEEMKIFLSEKIKKIVPNAIINGEGCSIPHIMSITIPKIDSGTLVSNLNLNGICVSEGSACINNKNSFSHVIHSMTGSEEKARETFRISLSKENTLKECEEFSVIFKKVISNIRQFTGIDE